MVGQPALGSRGQFLTVQLAFPSNVSVHMPALSSSALWQSYSARHSSQACSLSLGPLGSPFTQIEQMSMKSLLLLLVLSHPTMPIATNTIARGETNRPESDGANR